MIYSYDMNAEQVPANGRETVTRRRFLAAGGLAALGAWAHAPALAQGRRVVIVGAGLAGLYAARLLEQAGLDAVVVEARERVGGRVLTLDRIEGRPEAGGSQIGPNYGRLLAVAGQTGVAMRPSDAVETLPTAYLIDGHAESTRTWRDSVRNPLPDALKAVTPDRLGAFLLRDHPIRDASDWCNGVLAHLDVSAREHFLAQGLDEAGVSLLAVNNGYGNTLAETSLLSLYRVVAGFARAMATGRPTLEAVDGNLRLPERMAADLSRPVITGEAVTALERDGSGVAAGCRSGLRIEADAAIVTLPLPALRQVEFSPALPAPQREAINAIRYLKVTQAHLTASRTAWDASGIPGSVWSNAPFGRLFVRRPPGSGTCNITAWINGDSCDRYDELADEEAGNLVLEDIFRAYPGARGNVRLRRLVRWHLDPFSQEAGRCGRRGRSTATSPRRTGRRDRSISPENIRPASSRAWRGRWNPASGRRLKCCGIWRDPRAPPARSRPTSANSRWSRSVPLDASPRERPAALPNACRSLVPPRPCGSAFLQPR